MLAEFVCQDSPNDKSYLHVYLRGDQSVSGTASMHDALFKHPIPTSSKQREVGYELTISCICACLSAGHAESSLHDRCLLSLSETFR